MLVAQDVDNLLDLDCIPLTRQDVSLFNEKHKLMNSMFSTTLQNGRGENFFQRT